MSAYDTLYPFCRLLVGDRGVRDAGGEVLDHSHDYADEDIDAALDMALLEMPDYTSIALDTLPDLASDDDKGLLVSIAALYLATPDGPFSIETPNMKLRISENKDLLALLFGKIAKFADGDQSDVPAIWGAWDQLQNEGQLIGDRLTATVGVV